MTVRFRDPSASVPGRDVPTATLPGLSAGSPSRSGAARHGAAPNRYRIGAPGRRLLSAFGLLIFVVAWVVPLPRAGAQGGAASDSTVGVATTLAPPAPRSGTVATATTLSASTSGSEAPAATAASEEIDLTIGEAVVLGLVEGITEFLPVSSTGHLLVTSRLMGLDDTDEARDAIDSYSIAIQAGAMLAVVGLYWRRFLTLVEGILGRSDEGRRLLVALIVAFLPAAFFGFLLGDVIKENLFGYGPIAAAWLVGGVVILWFERRRSARGNEGNTLAQLTPRAALTIGFVQTIAMWPGVSRSLVTIIAALAVGLAMKDAVEFSFLLGAVTLGAATVYEGGRSGGEIIDTFGWVAPAVGIAVAFVSAAAAVAWLLSFLTKRGLAAFGWYRIAIGVLTLVALGAGWL